MPLTARETRRRRQRIVVAALRCRAAAQRSRRGGAPASIFIGELLRRAEAAAPMASTVPSSRTAGLAYCENALEAIGNTPLVKLNKVIDGARCLVLAKVEYVNPGGSVKDRPAVAMLDAAEREGLLKPGRHDRRADQREYRHRPGDGRRDSRLPLHPGDARQDVARKDRSAARLRRRRRHHADQRSARFARVVLRRRQPPGLGDSRRVSAESVSQSLQSRRALPHDRPRDLGADAADDHAFRCRHRHRRHDLRHRALSQREESGRFTSSAPIPRARSTPATFRARTPSKASA